MSSAEKLPHILEGSAVDDHMLKQKKKILFYTSSEYGQANVILAVAYDLLILQQYEIHIASFSPLRRRISELNDLVTVNSVPVIFHNILGPSALEALVGKGEFIGPYSPGVRGAINTYRITLPAMADTWTESEYMESYHQCLEIARSVNPDLIVVDPLMSQGLEACNNLSRNYVVLSPNTFLELLRKKQSLFSQFFKIPTLV